MERNQWMIGNSIVVIVYLREYNKKSKGGTFQAYKLAEKVGNKIIILYGDI